MNKVITIFLGAVILSAPALQSRSYGSVAGANAWVSSRNVAGIRQDTVSVSYAELYGKAVGGGFKASFESPFAWTAGAVAKTLRHFDRLSVMGSASFEQMTGQDMKGTMLMRPGFYPVDVIEFTPGLKTMQTYGLNGGAAYDLDTRWRIAAKVDFGYSDYRKHKDLCYDNSRMDLAVVPSLQYHEGDFSAGLSYVFSMNGETVTVRQEEASDQGYEAYFDRGLYYGRRDIWDAKGMFLAEAGGFPISETMHGAAAQVQWRGLFVDGEFLSRHGRVGGKQSPWFEFPGFEAKAGLRYSKKDRVGLHRLRTGFDWLHQDNYENDGLVYTRNFVTVDADYGYSFRGWTVGGDVRVIYRDGFSYLVDPACSQTLLVLSDGLYVAKSAGHFDMRVRFGVSEGINTDETGGFDPEDGLIDRLDAYNTGYLEYFCTAKSTVDLSVKYNFQSGMYVGIEGGWIHAPHVTFIQGTERFSGAFRVGYNF